MEEETNFDFKEIFEMFWKYKMIIIVVTAIFTMIGIVYDEYFVTPRYKATTTLLLAKNASSSTDEETSEINQNDINLNQKLVSTYGVIIKSNDVIVQVLKNLNISEDLKENVKEAITVQAVENTQAIEITYTDENPNNAYRITNQIVKVFGDKVKEIYNINNIYIIDKAELPEDPYNINHTKNILLFTCIGIGISLIGVVVISLLDTTVKKSEDVERTTGLIVLAKIPEVKTGGRKK